MRAYSVMVGGIILLLASACPSRAGVLQTALDANEQQLLTQLDPPVVKDLVDLAAKLAGWKQDLDNFAAQAQQMDAMNGTVAPELVLNIVLDLAQRSGALQQFAGLKADLVQKINGLQDDGKVDAALAAFKDVQAMVQVLQKAQNPAAYARGFLENEIKAKYFNKPYEVGDVHITLSQQDFRKSLFSKDANIKAKLDYGGDLGVPISVEVTGIYFAYVAGQLPEPRFDKVNAKGPEFTALLSSLANQQFSSLGPQIPDMGIGLKLTPSFLGFDQPDKRGRRGGIQCKVSLDASKLLDFIPNFSAQPKGTFTIYPSKKYLELDDFSAKITISNKDFIVDLIGVPLEMRGYEVSIDPGNKTRTFSVGTHFGPSGASEGVSFKLTVFCGLPVRGIEFEGDLVLGDDTQVLGTVKGKITRSEFSGTIDIPAKDGTSLPIKDIIKASGKFKFDRDGLSANANVTLYSVLGIAADMLLHPDGSGRFDYRESVDLGFARASETVEATFQKRFSNLELRASFTVSVGGLDGFGAAQAAVTTTIRDFKTVEVQWSALGMSDQFVMKRDDSLMEQLKQQLEGRLPRSIQALWNAAAEVDLFNKNSALRRGLAELDLFSTNPEARKAAQELANVRNDFIKAIPGAGAASDAISNTGGRAADWWHKNNPFSRLEPLLPRMPGSGTMSLVAFEEEGGPPALAPVADRAKAFLSKLKGFQFHETPAAEKHSSGARRLTRKTELFVKCDAATIAPEGKDDILIAFSLRCSGYQVEMSSQTGSKRSQGAEFKWASILLKNAQAKGAKTTVEIRLPTDLNRKKYTSLDVAGLVRDRVQSLVEKNLPDLSISGEQRFYEKHLAIKNTSDEPISVWIQARAYTHDKDGYQWRWLPADPGSGKSMKVVIPARTTRELKDEVSLRLPKLPRTGGSSTTLDVPFEASVVRMWAESTSGQRDLRYKDRDFWLVTENPKLDNERIYIAKEMETASHSFTFPKVTQPFSERVVLLKNESGDHLKVSSIKYRSQQNGKTDWHSLPGFELHPGETLQLHTADGSAVRASELLFTAEGSSLLFDQHAKTSLFLVAPVDGARIYSADTIGSYTYVFQAPLKGKKP